MNIECAVLRAIELVSTPNIRPKPLVYSGPGVMDKFYDHIMRESEVISAILANDRDMTALTATQQKDYQDATDCAECGGRLANRITKCDIMIMLRVSICFLPIIAVTSP